MNEGLRLATVSICCTVVVLGTPQLVRFARFLPENQFLWLSAIVTNLVILLSTLHALVKHLDGGFQVPLTTTAAAFLLFAVSYRPARWVHLHWWRVSSRFRRRRPTSPTEG